MALLNDGEIHDVMWNDSDQFTNISYNAKFYDFFAGDHLFVRHTLATIPDV